MRSLLIGVVLAALAGGAALAQDRNASPTHGTVSLSSGFSPDPRVVEVDLAGATIVAPCASLVREAADLHVSYGGGSTLIISVDSTSDTTLLVNGPDGAWYCDDDSGEAGANPAVSFDSAASGRYAIWVGANGSGSAQIAISASASH